LKINKIKRNKINKINKIKRNKIKKEIK